jgi:cyclopropane fatty-acyl-phospholipid synthase-like methyltransferase
MERLKIRDACRSGMNKYTRQAFGSLPAMDRPRILDLGCGTGVPSLEIARLTNGTIEAVDTDRESLDWLAEKVRDEGLEDRITISCKSVFELDLPQESYDIILMEGLLNIIGFKKGLRRFKPALRTGGHFLIHDDALHKKRKLRILNDLGLHLVDSFYIDEESWWKNYLAPLEEGIRDFENRNPERPDVLKQEKSEIAMYKRDVSMFRSAYYIIRKEIT